MSTDILQCVKCNTYRFIFWCHCCLLSPSIFLILYPHTSTYVSIYIQLGFSLFLLQSIGTAAVSVAVGVWTLVAISLERYFAICRPLKSRIWQTRSHAYKMIIAVWILSLSLCLPVAFLSRLKPIRETGKQSISYTVC